MSELPETSSPPQDDGGTQTASTRHAPVQLAPVRLAPTQPAQHLSGQDKSNPHHVELAADIVSAYVSKNSVPVADLPGLIGVVHGALRRVGAGTPAGVVAAPPKPAVPARKSVTDEFIICLEDGRKFKSLKRHLRTKYDLSPEQYREKWGLAADYPMVAPSYAKARSNLAKEMGLGQQRRRRG